jgi:hypothetical protein
VSIVCYALFAYDVGMGIQLDAAARLVHGSTRLGVMDRPRAMPRYLTFKQVPLRLLQRAEPPRVGSHALSEEIELVAFDFGALSVTYRMRVDGDLARALALSAELDESTALFTDSRRRVEELLEVMAPAVTRPQIADFVEDYLVFQLDDAGGAASDPARLIASNRHLLAQILRSERRPLSPHEIDDALASRIGYEAGEEAVIDWNAAILIQRDIEDVRPVLEYVNVELLELRWLDNQLDQALDRSYEMLAGRSASHRGWRRTFPLIPDREIRAVARLQMDNALLFEGVTNALKLVGDQYLARLYRLAAQRMRIPEWHANILRKLQVAESIHEKLSEEATRRRLEVLEWIIIALIALSTVMMFV